MWGWSSFRLGAWSQIIKKASLIVGMSFCVLIFSLFARSQLKTYTIRPIPVFIGGRGTATDLGSTVCSAKQAEKCSLSRLIQWNDVLVVLILKQAVRFSLDGSAVKMHVQAVRAAADADSADDRGMPTALINTAVWPTMLPVDQCRSVKAVRCRVRQAAVWRFADSAMFSKIVSGMEGRRPSVSECALYIYIFNIFDSFGDFETPLHQGFRDFIV